MYISYETLRMKNEIYKTKKVIIEPQNADIKTLNILTTGKQYQLENPAKTFANLYNAGFYKHFEDNYTACEAKAADLLANAWKNEQFENIFSVLANLMLMYIEKET